MTNIDSYLEDHLADKAQKDFEALYAKAQEENVAYDLRQQDNLYYQAFQANARFDQCQKQKPIYQRIASMINAMHVTTLLKAVYSTTDNFSHKLEIGGVDVTFYISIERDANRKDRIVVGNYGDRTSYPQRKDGTYNYDAISTKLVGYAERRIQENAARRRTASNAVTVSELRNELGLHEYYGTMTVSASPSVEAPVYVKLKIERAMSVEKARALAEALKAIGYDLSK